MIENLHVWTFEPDWDSEVVESLEFLTNILRSKAGAEQRRANRNTPRRMMEIDLTVYERERTAVSRFITMLGATQFYMPLWFDQYETNALSPSGANDLFVPVIDVMMKAGDPILIYGDGFTDFEVNEIESFEADRIVTVSPMVNDWPSGTRVYKLVKAQFVEQPSMDEYGAKVDKGSVKILAMQPNEWNLESFEVDPGVPDAPYGPLIGLATPFVSHSYHDMTDPTGRAEDQFGLAAAMFAVQEVLALEGTEEADNASRYYLDLALSMMDAIGNGETFVPVLRYPLGSADILNLPHYRFAARSNAQIGEVTFEEVFTAEDNTLLIPDANETGVDLQNIFKIYPTTAELHFEKPWAPAFDTGTPTVDVSIPITEWMAADEGIYVPIPITAPDYIDEWNIVYSYHSSNVVEIGEAFGIVPVIAPIRTYTAELSGDISHWYEKALSRAYDFENRLGYEAASWAELRSQFLETDVKSRRIDDQRWIIKQMPLADPIPALDDIPKGFFCYSNHPDASAPGEIAATDSSWTGYNFWSRDSNGDLTATTLAPGQLSRVQFGRVFADQWRTATSFQDPDQYLYVALACSRKPVLASGEYFLLWVSESDEDDEADRWFADLGSKSAFVATSLASGNVIEFLIPISELKRRSYNGAGVSVWGTTMPVGQILKSFGISAEYNNNIDIRLREMRILAGPSTAWVNANLPKAKRGYAMAFAPGVAPSLINLIMDQQRFEGMNFSPMHGYQFAEFWKIAEEEANFTYTGLTVTDLPIPDRVTNVIGYPISATTAGAVTKTPAALLMEQQLRFLDHAQKEFQADGGSLGPFAHTYTMNTYDRLLFKDSAHSKWVYENVRPYTQWGGFQYRVFESLAQTIDKVGVGGVYADSRALAVTLFTNFATWLNGAWPNLTGIYVGYDGLRVFSGDEADYAKRFTGDENPFMEVYEDEIN